MYVASVRNFCRGANKFNLKCKQFKILKSFTQNELDEFSKLTGDLNHVHSKETSLHERMVHGAFLNAIVSGIMGTHFPGSGTIVLEQSIKFPKACRVDVPAEICVRLTKERKISKAEFTIRQNGVIVFEGEAKLLIKERM